jgi:hypothetical protein
MDGSLCNVQLEAHHGFVDAADLLHIEVAIAETLAIENQQVAVRTR